MLQSLSDRARDNASAMGMTQPYWCPQPDIGNRPPSPVWERYLLKLTFGNLGASPQVCRCPEKCLVQRLTSDQFRSAFRRMDVKAALQALF